MPLPYYQRLSSTQKRIYRASDALVAPVLPGPAQLAGEVGAIRLALEADDVRTTQRASTRLLHGVLTQLDAPPARVRVLSVRPGDEYEELHGLYEAEEGQRPVIRVWMRTNVKKQPVALRTFVRTLLHEVCHHLDFFMYDLDESFHTEGFFRREAALARQLLGPAPPASPRAQPRRAAQRTQPEPSRQMELAFVSAPARRR